MKRITFAVFNETKERVVIRHETENQAREWLGKMHRIFKDKTPVYVLMKLTTTYEEI